MRLFFKEKHSLVLTAGVLFACKLVSGKAKQKINPDCLWKLQTDLFIYQRSRTGGSRRCWHFSLLWILKIYLDHKAMFNFTVINDFLTGFGSTLMQVSGPYGVQKNCTLNHIQVDSSGWVQTRAKQSQLWRQTQVCTKRSNLKAPLKRHPSELKQLANKSTTLLVTADLVVFVLEGNFPLYNFTALPFHY